MRTLLATTAVLAGTLLLSACGKEGTDGQGGGASRLHGTWVADVEGTLAMMKERGASEEELADTRMGLDMVAKSGAFITFSPDGTVTAMDPGTAEKKGTYAVVKRDGDTWVVETTYEGKAKDSGQVRWIDEDHAVVGDVGRPADVVFMRK